jgi:hypothetical protein
MLPGTNNKQKIRSLAVQEVTRVSFHKMENAEKYMIRNVLQLYRFSQKRVNY